MHWCVGRFFVPAKSRKEGVVGATPTGRDDAGAEKNQHIKALMIEISIRWILDQMPRSVPLIICLWLVSIHSLNSGQIVRGRELDDSLFSFSLPRMLYVPSGNTGQTEELAQSQTVWISKDISPLISTKQQKRINSKNRLFRQKRLLAYCLIPLFKLLGLFL